MQEVIQLKSPTAQVWRGGIVAKKLVKIFDSPEVKGTLCKNGHLALIYR